MEQGQSVLADTNKGKCGQKSTYSHFSLEYSCPKNSLVSKLGKRFTKMAVGRWHAGAKEEVRKCNFWSSSIPLLNGFVLSPQFMAEAYSNCFCWGIIAHMPKMLRSDLTPNRATRKRNSFCSPPLRHNKFGWQYLSNRESYLSSAGGKMSWTSRAFQIRLT